jgi:hypothetical protein
LPHLVGAGLALATCLLAKFVGLDGDRAFYPTVTIVIASYYALFAVMGQSTAALGHESAVILLFLFASALGFKRNMWIVVGALCAHGIFDAVHGHLIANPRRLNLWRRTIPMGGSVAFSASRGWSDSRQNEGRREPRRCALRSALVFGTGDILSDPTPLTDDELDRLESAAIGYSPFRRPRP